MYFASGRVEKSGVTVGHAQRFGTGDVIGCHVDTAKGIMYFRKNGRRIGESPERGYVFWRGDTANILCFQV